MSPALFDTKSFRIRIIRKIVASVDYYLNERNIENAEAGLSTLLRITGSITEDIVEVFFSYLKLKYPSNYISTAAYLNNLRSRQGNAYQNGLLDFELLMCAFQEKNYSAVNQLLVRFEDRANDIYLNMVKYILASGVTNKQGPNNSFKTIFTSSVLSEHRMLAQLASKIGSTLPDHLSEAIETHSDLQTIKFQTLDIDLMHSYLLLPNFIPELKDYVVKLVHDQSKESDILKKARFIYYLLCALSFNARNRNQFISSQRYCFNLLLYLKATQVKIESKIHYSTNSKTYVEDEYFQNNRDPDSKSILFLLNQ